MTGFSKLKFSLLAAGAAVALAGCGGADRVVSPGEGQFNGGGGGGTGGGGGGGGGTGAAADCPTGFVNVGTVANGALRNCQLPSLITGNLVVPTRSGTVYSISGRTDVGVDLGPDPAAPLAGGQQGVLTIDPGVRIFGSSGADYLVVNRGSQIFASGTNSSPIVFTSRQSIEGQTTVDSIGQWGGIVILGRAPTNACPTGVTPPNIACVSTTEGTSAVHGGNTPTDNSGVLRYVRVMHSGYQVVPGRELNGITFGAVGSGTLVDFVQVHNSSDDGMEFFGGTVNLKHLVFTGIDDDDLDTDNGWRGAVQFMIAVKRANGGDRNFEASCAGSTAMCSHPLVANATLVQRTGGGDNMVMNTGTDYTLVNSVVTGPTACLDIDDAATQAADPTFQSVFLSCTTAFRDDSGVNGAATQALFSDSPNNVTNGTSTLSNGFVNGANESAVTPTNPTTVSAFFENVAYIGAVRNAADNWWQGWTCGLPGAATC